MLGFQPAGEDRRRQAGGLEQDPVELRDDELRQDDAGLIGQQVIERFVLPDPAGRLDEAGGEHVLQVGDLHHRNRWRRKEPATSVLVTTARILLVAAKVQTVARGGEAIRAMSLHRPVGQALTG
ncbi:MAG TPA: hypothetical protein VHY81_10990 [Acidimicrobiales bacterium]|nr:hypothetical protein [Acidimicrobiales bacterium]